MAFLHHYRAISEKRDEIEPKLVQNVNRKSHTLYRFSWFSPYFHFRFRRYGRRDAIFGVFHGRTRVLSLYDVCRIDGDVKFVTILLFPVHVDIGSGFYRQYDCRPPVVWYWSRLRSSRGGFQMPSDGHISTSGTPNNRK